MSRLLRALRRQGLPALIVMALGGLFIVYPLTGALMKGISWDLFKNVVVSPNARESVVNSIKIALLTTLVSIVIALPFAYLTTRFRFPGRSLARMLLLTPLIVPPFVGAFGLLRILSVDGSINALLMDLHLIHAPVKLYELYPVPCIVFLQSLGSFPILFIMISAALDNIDPDLESAAANLGAPPLRTFWSVTRPLATPGVLAGALLVFVGSFTDLGTPLIFNLTRVLPMEIFRRLQEVDSSGMVYTYVLIMILVNVVFFSAAVLLSGKEQATMFGAAGGEERPRRPMSALGSVLTWLSIAGLGLVMLLPHLSILFTSIENKWSYTILPQTTTTAHYKDVLANPLTMISIENSLLFAVGATLIDMVLGFLFAYWVTRPWNRLGKYFDALAMVPLAVPGLVLAFSFLAAFRWWPGLDARVNPTLPLIAAYSIRRFPYMVRACVAGFQQVHPAMEEASANLGARGWRTLTRILAPLVAGGLAAGAVLTFAYSMLEVSDSLILADRETYYPITKALYLLLSYDNGQQAACAFGVWTMAFLATSLIVAWLFMRARRPPARE
ncbi:MAG: ABC transporter permease [Planctomycetota bacterium]